MNNYHSFSPRTTSKWLLRKARGNFHHPPRARVDRRELHFFFCSRMRGKEDFEITRARWKGVSVGRGYRRDWRQHLTYLSDRLGISSIKPSTYSWVGGCGGFRKHREEVKMEQNLRLEIYRSSWSPGSPFSGTLEPQIVLSKWRDFPLEGQTCRPSFSYKKYWASRSEYLYLSLVSRFPIESDHTFVYNTYTRDGPKKYGFYVA